MTSTARTCIPIFFVTFPIFVSEAKFASSRFRLRKFCNSSQIWAYIFFKFAVHHKISPFFLFIIFDSSFLMQKKEKNYEVDSHRISFFVFLHVGNFCIYGYLALALLFVASLPICMLVFAFAIVEHCLFFIPFI